MTDMKLKVQYLENYNTLWPKLCYAHEGDSGLDLRACLDEEIILAPGERRLIPNGIKLEIDSPNTAVEIQIRARSGLALNYGIICANGIGTVDFGYRGEIKTILANYGQKDFVIQPGDRIAQAVICPIYRPLIIPVEDIGATTRGPQGFGSTGQV